MNRILYADDCLNVLNDPDKLPDESVDLIYLDPPFNSNSSYNLPFKGKDKSLKPVEAFTDTWTWTQKDDENFRQLELHPQTRPLATVVKFAQDIEQMFGGGRRRKSSLAAYLLNMALRLRAMRRVLKETGSIYLHCDATAGHYLKLLMDTIYRKENARNEIVWCYHGPGSPRMRQFNRKHDTIFWYNKGKKWTFNREAVRIPYKDGKPHTGGFTHKSGDKAGTNMNAEVANSYTGKIPEDWWYFAIAARSKREYVGYPTQKPLALLERIIKASSNPDDIVLDPFCGCGTTMHAAEKLGRRWVGIDISPFSTGLIRERIVDNFELLSKGDITVYGVPHSVADARELASRDKFEFEKWVCGHIGAAGMFHEPGTRGADGGVDGLLEIYPIRVGQRAKAEYAVVQVKGGHVSADAVRALYATVKRFELRAGILVCFGEQMGTVNNQRSRETFADSLGTYPVIQGYSVADLLRDKPLALPMYGARRRGAALI